MATLAAADQLFFRKGCMGKGGGVEDEVTMRGRGGVGLGWGETFGECLVYIHVIYINV